MRRRWQAVGHGRYHIGPGLIANQRLHLSGPGHIALGRDVNAWARAGSNVLSTHDPNARIVVGERVRLNGAGIQAATSVTVGDDCILASCTVVDTDHHAVEPSRRHERDAVQTAAVVLERNVWIVGGTMILKGVHIGEGSIVGFGSLVTHDIPAGVVAAGRPARVVRLLRPDVALPLTMWRLELATTEVTGGAAEAAERVRTSLGSRDREVEEHRVTVVGETLVVSLTLAAGDRLEAIRTAVRVLDEAVVDTDTCGAAVSSLSVAPV